MDIKKLLFLPCMLGLLILASCSDDNNDNISPVAERPVYGNLSLSTIMDLSTPYEYIFNPQSNNARFLEEDVKASIRAKIDEIFPDATYIDEIESDTERGIPVWEVELEMPSGAEVDFYISKDLEEVIKISGDDDDIDYEIEPGGDFITLSQAISSARQSVSGEVDEWELELNDNQVWVYEIEFEDRDDTEVFVHAYTGEVIAVYRDDDDDDDDDDD